MIEWFQNYSFNKGKVYSKFLKMINTIYEKITF